MKDTNEVFAAIETIAAASGKQKEVLLAEYLQSPLFERVVKAAYCPFTTYGVKRYARTQVGSETAVFDDSDWAFLDQLAERKITGSAAISQCTIAHSQLSRESAELFDRILKKDLRAGFTAKTVNKAKPGTIFVFSCMLAHKYEPKRIKSFPVAVETKLDGVRVIAMRVPKASGPYRFFSRTGKEFLAYQHLGKELEKLSGTDSLVFDGEVVDASGSFNETVGAAHRKDQAAVNARFHVFDFAHRTVFDSEEFDVAYIDRKKALQRYFDLASDEPENVVFHQHYLANSHSEITMIYQNARDNDLEGVIVKPLDALYQRKRSHNWLKVKDEQTVDVPIVGYVEGTGKYEGTLGALVVDYNGKEVNVGSGLSDVDRDYFWKHQTKYQNILVEVEYHEETPDGSLRHPRFVRLREDKPVEDGVGC